MSSDIDAPDHEQRRQENLDRLYDLREELETVADSDADYAAYAESFLETLREAGMLDD